jgi:hypothetical protein
MQDTVDQAPSPPRTLPQIIRHGCCPSPAAPTGLLARCGCTHAARTGCTRPVRPGALRGPISETDTERAVPDRAPGSRRYATVTASPVESW